MLKFIIRRIFMVTYFIGCSRISRLIYRSHSKRCFYRGPGSVSGDFMAGAIARRVKCASAKSSLGQCPRACERPALASRRIRRTALKILQAPASLVFASIALTLFWVSPAISPFIEHGRFKSLPVAWFAEASLLILGMFYILIFPQFFGIVVDVCSQDVTTPAPLTESGSIFLG